ncbi:MAG: hypothetical protein NC418_00515 [Muribaculaceae bacterium]|nr:hypothetical protein [Muribaculaceae bacterium]
MKKLFTTLAACALAAMLTCTASDTRYLPLNTTFYRWNANSGEWTESYRDTYTVNDRGYYTSQTTSYAGNSMDVKRVTTNYYEGTDLVSETISENSSDNGATWSPISRTTSRYDDVVPNFTVDYRSFSWEDGSWAESYFNRYLITRNAQNVVTRLVNQTPYSSEPCIDAGILETTVAPDGNITAMKATRLDVFTMKQEETLDLRDIVWHDTDGQILTVAPSLYLGNNRVASAKLYSEGELTAKLTGTYPNDYDGTLVYEYENGLKDTYSIYRTDEATKSYVDKTETQSYIKGTPTDDLNGDGVINEQDAPQEVATRTVTYTYQYDEHDNATLNSYEIIEADGTRNFTCYMFENTYNEDGALTEQIFYNYDENNDSKTPLSRQVHEDFRSFSGIAEVEVDESDAPVEYFNLQGLPVAHPADGIFIRRQGPKVSKVRM